MAIVFFIFNKFSYFFLFAAHLKNISSFNYPVKRKWLLFKLSSVQSCHHCHIITAPLSSPATSFNIIKHYEYNVKLFQSPRLFNNTYCCFLSPYTHTITLLQFLFIIVLLGYTLSLSHIYSMVLSVKHVNKWLSRVLKVCWLKLIVISGVLTKLKPKQNLVFQFLKCIMYNILYFQLQQKTAFVGIMFLYHYYTLHHRD